MDNVFPVSKMLDGHGPKPVYDIGSTVTELSVSLYSVTYGILHFAQTNILRVSTIPV